MKEGEYVVVGKDGRFGKRMFALGYRGNCENCEWLPSGYCPCLEKKRDGEVEYKGMRIPLFVFGPGKNAPEDCWKENRV